MTTNAKNLVSGRQIEEAWKVLDDALNGKVDGIECAYGDSFPMEKLIEAIAPMLAQAGDAVSEPVAEVIKVELLRGQATVKCALDSDGITVLKVGEKLYTTPPHDDGKVARDAERYRWLRKNWFEFGHHNNMRSKLGAQHSSIFQAGDLETLDAAIDAAIKEQWG